MERKLTVDALNQRTTPKLVLLDLWVTINLRLCVVLEIWEIKVAAALHPAIGVVVCVEEKLRN